MMADESSGTRDTREPWRWESALARVRQRRALAVAGFAVALCAAGAGLAAGALRSPQPLSTPRLGPEVPATTTDLGINEANNSPMLVADPTEPRFVALANRLDAPDFSCALQVSGDSGQSWTSAQGAPELPAGAEKCYAPEIAFDARGRLYYLFVGLAGPGNRPMGAFLSMSADRGVTFSPPRQVLGPLNFSVRMAIDPTAGPQGRIHLVWLQTSSEPVFGGFGPPPNPIMAAYSDDGGQTFSSPVQVSDPQRLRVVAPALALGADRRVTVAYYDLEDDARDYQGLQGPTWEGSWSLVAATSLDGGQTFAPGRPVDEDIVPSERVMLIFTMPPPAVATRPDGGLCLAWTDARHGDPDVMMRCSADQAGEWAPLQRLNDDVIGNGSRQYLPRLSVSPQGRIDAIFYDRRADPQNLRNDVWFTRSDDGGQRFSPNIRLTRSSSDSQIGQRYAGVAAEGQVEFGSRLALWSTATSATAAWPDTRNSRFSPVAQDIFVTQLELAKVNASPGSRLAGIALLGFGVVLAGGAASRRRWPFPGTAL